MMFTAYALFGVLMAAGVITAWWKGRSAGSLLATTMVRALLTVAVAAGLTAWQVRAAFVGIAQTGSGGIGTLVPRLAEAMTMLRVGVVMAVLLLAVGLVLSWAGRGVTRPVASTMWVTATVAGLLLLGVAAGVAVWGAERSAGLPAAHLGKFTATPAPPEYAWAVSESGQQFAAESEIIQPTIEGSVALVVVLTACLFMMGRRDWFASAAALASNLTRAIVAVGIVVSTWYAVHMGPMTTWVRDLAERLS